MELRRTTKIVEKRSSERKVNEDSWWTYKSKEIQQQLAKKKEIERPC